MNVLDISWTRASSLFAPFQLVPNLTILDISGTQLFQSFDCMKTLLRLENLQELRMDYCQIIATSIRRPRASLNYDTTYMYAYITNCLFKNRCDNVSVFANGCYLLPPRLKSLHLMHAAAAEFYIDFQEDVCINSDLEYLNLKNLRITKPIGTITGLHSLKSLDVSNTASRKQVRVTNTPLHPTFI